ncbi:Anhydrotetracycline monooxygenase [Massilia sp. Bi118]|uniref:FAD-dependent oxidoreductase n=1 Tax=Massilia sp. Bi118 TaxID=2822346 RepID=UPI001D7ABB54|nr:FAD-dependent oxidoreductase [Massilia sp. Bi118]CAH0315938.1 Anhydrotetracycline monooxygenase [Massilia sp. Bi118]
MQATQMQYDAVIAGAGPVGLFLSCELALAGCSVLVLERDADPDSPFKHLPFGIRGLSAPAIDALYRRGLLGELEVPRRLKNPFGGGSTQAGRAPRQAGHFAGIGFQAERIDASRWPWRLPGSPPASLIAEMAELEIVLARRAQALGVAIRRGYAVSGIAQDADGVDVQAGALQVRARWLVGCDGARSSVRKLCGFDFAGTDPEFTGYSARVELADPSLPGPGRQLTPRGMVFQSQPGYLAIQEFDGGAGHDGTPVTRERLQEVLRRVSGSDLTVTTLHAASTWTDRARQATRYRQGRVLLAGDAAHIHAPLGGQGLNLGIGDAMNLGWKLAATMKGTAAAGLLDTYEAERHPIGGKVLDWSRAQVVLMRPDPASRALRAIVEDLMDTADGATYMAGRVWGVETHYDLGDDHPLIGRSAPDFEFADGSRLGQHMHDGRAILLDFSGDATTQGQAAAYGLAFKHVKAQAREDFGLRALLIRPDGFIAAAWDL